MSAVARRPLVQVLRVTPALLGVSVLCLFAVKIPGVGVEVNGATRWLGAGPLTFQPSELAKLALILYAARFLAERPRELPHARRAAAARARDGARRRARRLRSPTSARRS